LLLLPLFVLPLLLPLDGELDCVGALLPETGDGEPDGEPDGDVEGEPEGTEEGEPEGDVGCGVEVAEPLGLGEAPPPLVVESDAGRPVVMATVKPASVAVAYEVDAVDVADVVDVESVLLADVALVDNDEESELDEEELVEDDEEEESDDDDELVEDDEVEEESDDDDELEEERVEDDEVEEESDDDEDEVEELRLDVLANVVVEEDDVVPSSVDAEVKNTDIHELNV